MTSLTKKILFITLPFALTACAYDVQHYIPYNTNVAPAPRYYPPNNHYHQSYPQQPNAYYAKPSHNEQRGYNNEHHDNGKHKGRHKNKHHDDDD